MSWSGTSRRFSRPDGDERGDERRVERQLLGPRSSAPTISRWSIAVVSLVFADRMPKTIADGLALAVAVARDEDDGVAADRELAGLSGLGRLA